MDHLSASARSSLMAKVRSANTKPEWRVRRAAYALGLRFRLHRRDLPGTPDLVFPNIESLYSFMAVSGTVIRGVVAHPFPNRERIFGRPS